MKKDMKVNTLKNGINTLFVNKNNSDLVLIGFTCKTGYVNEYKNFPNGISLLIEKLFLHGTHKNPSTKKIWMAIESIGGRWYSDTEAEIMSFYLLLPQENQYKGISLMSEIIQKSYFEDDDIEICKSELIEDIKSIRKGTNVNFGFENLYTCFGYSNKKIGTIDQIISINQSTVFDYLSRQFRPGNCYLTISGNFQLKPLQELIEQEWGYWLPTIRKTDEIYFDIEVCKNDLPKIPFLQSAKLDTDVNINFLLPEGIVPKELLNINELQDKNWLSQVWDNYIERIAIYTMINELLIGGNSGKLYAKTVTDERLVNHIQSEIVFFAKSANLSIYFNADNQNFNQALTAVLQVLEELKRNVLNPTELNRIKEMVKLNLLLLKSNLLESTMFYVKNYILGGHHYEINDLLTKVNYIENSQIRSFCLELFNSSILSMSMIGTNKEGKVIEKQISRFLD
jgi:predicted Zn-dependent peptidase